MGSVYQTCAYQFGGDDGSGVVNNAQMLQCLSDALESSNGDQNLDLDSWLLVLAGAMVFFMQTGFAMICAGCVRKKNVQNTLLKNLLDACGGAIGFFCIGFAFAFGGQNDTTDITFIGNKNFFGMGDFNPALWFFEFTFAASSVTIVAGTIAERCQMAAYFLYSVFLTSFVYPVVAHSLWSNNGFLSAFAAAPFKGVGVYDFAGSGVVHLTGGTTSLVATYILGARKGRFVDRRGRPLAKPKDFPGHSMALQLLGTLVLWFAWYGFNPGSAVLLPNASSRGYVAAVVACNTTLSGACGAVVALFTHMYLEERRTGEYNFNLVMAMNGCLSGLAAITAPCGTVEPWGACLIGSVAAWIYISGSSLLLKLQLDDVVDAIPVHMFNGFWGLISVGLFSSPRHCMAAFGVDEHVGWFFSLGRGSFDATLLLNQCIAALFIIGWTVACMLPFFLWLNYMGWLRSDSLEELVGLDMSYHGGTHKDEDEANDEDVQEYLKLRGRQDKGDDDEVVDREDGESWAEMTASAPKESARRSRPQLQLTQTETSAEAAI